jgi:hypothetical protein
LQEIFEAELIIQQVLNIGVGNIEGEVEAPAVTATITGTGTIMLHGHTKDFDCQLSGVGHADFENWKVKTLQ